MRPPLHDVEPPIGALAGHAIDQPVFARNAARPPALQRVFEGLGFAEPLEWIAFDVLDQRVDGGKDLFVRLLPMQIILPGILGPRDLHFSLAPPFFGSTFSPFLSLPRSASLIERNSSAALAGLLS